MFVALIASCASVAPRPEPAAALRDSARTLSAHVREVFRTRYAPADLKRRTLGWDLERELTRLDATIEASPSPSKAELQQAFRRFFQSMRDIHTSIERSESHAVWLGIHIMATESGARVGWIDPKLTVGLALRVGDEITRFGGQPVAEAMREIAETDGYHSTAAFERSFADWFLTVRTTDELPAIPSPGTPVLLEARRGTELVRVELAWRDLRKDPPSERCPFWSQAKQSALPPLGNVLWRSDPEARFVAYVFEAGGHRYGFLRLHTYNLPKAEQLLAIRDFNSAVDAFIEQKVEAVVLDQRGNDGGNFLFAYALFARLLDKPLLPTRQRFLIDGDEVVGLGPRAALMALAAPLEAAKTEAEARAALDATPLLSEFFGFGPRDLATAHAIGGFFRFFERQRDGLTEPHYVLVPEVMPDHRWGAVFTKPVLMLIDGMDISAADYAAATLRDNRRVTLLGETTSGAGGDQRRVGVDRVCTDPRPLFLACAPRAVADAMKQLGIAGFTYTVTLGQRAGGQVIENVGMSPDVQYRVGAEDLTTGFAPMRAKILETLETMH